MTPRRLPALLGLAAALPLLQGCLATYVPKPEEKMVTVRTVGLGRPEMCKDGQRYEPPRAQDDPLAIRVPAGHRLTLGTHIESAGYQVVHFCRPFLSFEPVDGQRYVMNSALDGQGRCFVELVREDATGENGLSPERSVGRATCGGR